MGNQAKLLLVGIVCTYMCTFEKGYSDLEEADCSEVIPEVPCYTCPEKPGRSFRFGAGGSFLYWRVLEEGGTCDCNCESRRKNSNWSYGYRVAVAAESLCRKVQGAVIWTHFQQSPQRGCQETCGDHWKLRYDTIDGRLMGQYSLSTCFSLNPYVGLRGARINQNVFNICLQKSHCLEDNFDVIIERRNRADFKAVGPLFGIVADYNFTRCIAVFSNFSFGVLYGNHHLHSFGSDTFTDPEQVCICNQKIGREASQLFIDLAVGIKMEKAICRTIFLVPQIALEHHRYFDFNRIDGVGDLCFDGVTVSLGLGF